MMMFTNTAETEAAYLLTLPAIRDRCLKVYNLATQSKLKYFDYHPEEEDKVAEFCVDIIKRDFGTNYSSIPPHGRWRHIDAGRPRVEPLLREWNSSPNPPSKEECCKRLIDLFLVSVLLDAGAGNVWSYQERGGQKFNRSEGLGVASFDMFASGFFSGDAEQKYMVDATGLSRITPERLGVAMQVNEQSNPLVGLAGRATLLTDLAKALRSDSNRAIFGPEARPGNMIDYLQAQSKSIDGHTTVHISTLWGVLIQTLSPIWPARETLSGISLGDVWKCNSLEVSTNEGDDLIPFHKLTGWTSYSLIEPMEKLLGWKFADVDLLTGLPEYRNGGLLVDHGVLSIKETEFPEQPVSPSHSAIVEWRAMTVIILDRIAEKIHTQLKLAPSTLTLAQILESATWKGGREIAKRKRPETGGPPIEIESDGTVF